MELAIAQPAKKQNKPTAKNHNRRSSGHGETVIAAMRGRRQSHAPSAATFKFGRRDDAFEKEADRVADHVVSNSPRVSHTSPATPRNDSTPLDRTVHTSTKPTHLQRFCAHCEEEYQLKSSERDEEPDGPQWDVESSLVRSTQLAEDIRAIRYGGVPLANREYFEHRMGHDFSAVRIHHDPKANKLAAQLGARAVTHGEHILFSRSAYDTQSLAGKHLLAHELTHVVQQDAAKPAGMPVGAFSQQASSPDLQANLLDDAGNLWDRGVNRVANTASSISSSVVAGGRAVGGEVVRGAQYVGGLAVDAYESTRDFLLDYLETYAPDLLAFLRGETDVVGNIKQKIMESLDYLFAGFGSRIKEEGLVGALTNAFGEFTGTVRQIATDLANGDCRSLFVAMKSIGNFGARLLGPAFDQLRVLLTVTGDFFGGLWQDIGAPALDAIKTLAGDSWTWIKKEARWLWEQTAGLRNMAGYIWTEFKRLFKISWNSASQLFDDLTAKAAIAWQEIKNYLNPILGPLKVAGAVFLLFTPMAPIVLVAAGVPLLWQGVNWIIDNWDDLSIVITAREVLANQIVPVLESGLVTLQAFLAVGSTWLQDQAESISTAIRNLLAAVGAMPIVKQLHKLLSGIGSKIEEAMAWLGTAFSSILEDLKALAVEYLSYLRPLGVLLFSIIVFPVQPWILSVVLTGWAWRALPDCLKPPIIDFWLEVATAFVQAMPNFERFGEAWPQAKIKIVEALEALKASDTETKIAGSNRIARMMTGEDFTWVANLARAALQMPDHFRGKVEKELIGHDLSQPLPIERLPEEVLLAQQGDPTVDDAAAFLNKGNLTERDVVVDPVAFTTWQPELLAELNIPDGGELFLGRAQSENAASPEAPQGGLADHGAESPDQPEPIPDNPEDQLAYLADKPIEMNCGDKEKKQEPASVEEVPAAARRFGPFSPMQRLSYLLNQMGKGVSIWFNCNRRWLIPTLIVAIVALIAAIAVTGGAIVSVLVSLLKIIGAVLIGVSAVRMTAWISQYISLGIAGRIVESAKALARALAIGSLELVFALLFGLGPIMKSARAGFSGARSAGRGVAAAVGTGTKLGARTTRDVVRSAFVPSLHGAGKELTGGVSKSFEIGSRNLGRAGGAAIRNGRLIINGVQDGFAAGVRNIRQLRNTLSRFRFRGFSMSRSRSLYFLWGHFNPKVLILVGPGHFEDLILPKGATARTGAGVTVPNRRYPAIVVEESDAALMRAFESMSAKERRNIVVQLQNAADDAARRRVLDQAMKPPLHVRFKDPVQLDEFRRLNQVDQATQRLRPGEASAAVDIQNALGGKLRRARSGDGDVDFVFSSGPHQGKTVDFMFTTDTIEQVHLMNRWFDKNLVNMKKEIIIHVRKADIVPLDLRNLNVENQMKIIEFIKTLSHDQKSRLIIMK